MTREEKLTQLAIKYQTDKTGHGYLPFLAKYLPENPISILEIGVWHGASCIMFDDFYDHRVDIHLVDLFQEGSFKPRDARNLGFVPHIGSQTDLAFLSTIKEQFDYVSEDASHNSPDQIITWKHIFVNNLKSGGLYSCEDLHACTDEFYWSSHPYIHSVDDTMLGLAKTFIETGKIVNPFFSKEEAEVFENIIDRMELCASDKIVFIWKK